MFQPYRAIIGPYYKNRFIHFQYILGSQIVYKGGIMLQCCVLLLRLKLILNKLINRQTSILISVLTLTLKTLN